MSNYFYWFGSWSYGLWTIRIHTKALQLKAPWNAPLFSEREGYAKTVIGKSTGWRLLYRKDC